MEFSLLYTHYCLQLPDRSKNSLVSVSINVPRNKVNFNKDYNRSSSVTYMLELLQWPTLSNRRYTSRLHMFYKSVYHLTAVQLAIPPYFLRTQQSTRQYHPLQFIVPSTNCDYYKYSFSKSNLPHDLIESS